MTDVISRASANCPELASPSEPAKPLRSTTTDDLDWLRQLDEQAFQRLARQAYEFQGYAVSTTLSSNGGRYLTLTLGDERIIVQCEHWHATQVDVQEVGELFGLAAANAATWAVAATSGEFTAEAKEFAAHNRLTLLDAPAVAQLISIGQVSQAATGTPFLHSSPVPPPANRPSQPVPRATHPCDCEEISNQAAPSPADFQTAVIEGKRTPGTRRVRAFTWLAIAPVVALAVLGSAKLMANNSTASLTSPPPPAAATPAIAEVFGEQPVDISFDAQDNLVYTANYLGGDVTVADAKTLTPSKRLDVPGKPIAIAVDPTHHRLFAADGATAKIYVVDTVNGKVGKTIELSAKATDLAFDTARQRLFVVSSAGKSLAVFNTITLAKVGQVATLGRGSSVALDSATHLSYVAVEQSVVPFDQYLRRHTALTLPDGSPTALGVNSKQEKLYSLSGPALQEYNLRSGNTRTLDVGNGAGALCINESAQVAYVTYPDANKLAAISLR
jgi:hypothetical protein